MKIGRKKAKIITAAINEWEAASQLSPEDSQKLRQSLEVVPFDWRRLAKYSFWIAIICLIIALQALIVDLEKFFKYIWDRPLIGFSFCVLVAAGLFFWGLKRRARHPGKIFSNEAVFFLGVLAVAAAITFLGKALDSGSRHYSLLLLLAALVYAALGLWLPSRLVWWFALVSLGSWFGAETGYISGWGAYFLGMNYPLRFVFFGLAVVGVSFVLKFSPRFADFFKVTYIMGLLYLFIALWILSIFGNFGEIARWSKAGRFELLSWSLLFGAAALTAIFFGLRYDDTISRGFGITFLFINLYTKYFEYFWDALHKAVFFAILGISFWYLGTRAEKIWLLGEGSKSPNENNKEP
ncbi:MAG: hypothetical protein WAU47_13355 [Desulfobaccales bacterium]